ncbi:cactin-like [Teleopsis dalmanni]|uniref:cactin-like n=1 Tax=Teleopsis dalmanni TaxID=139649 RepID=UPI0018CCF6C5|nr:cactin-like [Teleopsis dalmanni]
MQMHEPYVILNGLSFKDLEDLLVDIKVYVELEKGNNNDFWDDMITIVVDELQKIKKLMERSDEKSTSDRRREGIHHCVTKNVADIFRGKSTSQLLELRNRIENKINQRDNGVDISYWESLYSQLKAHMARSRLRDRHQENLKIKLETLKKTNSYSEKAELSTTKFMFNNHAGNSTSSHCTFSFENENSDVNDIKSEHDSCFHLYRSGNYTPKYLSLSDLNDDVVLLHEHQNKEHIQKLRNVLIQKRNEEKIMTDEELKMEIEARKGMLSDEEEFSVEASLNASIQSNSDKYRPRKPRYFNRVHTGFEWNKYNQTHYDMDNPPPKIVQGYKFNIFYPDLINKAITPQYHLMQ